MPLAKGQKHSGSFKAGYDPRRNALGRPKRPREFEEFVREKSIQAVETLVSCLDDPQAHWRDRRGAAELLLAHGWGQPVSRHLLAQTGSEGHTTSLNINQIRERVGHLLENLDADVLEADYREVTDDDESLY